MNRSGDLRNLDLTLHEIKRSNLYLIIHFNHLVHKNKPLILINQMKNLLCDLSMNK